MSCPCFIIPPHLMRGMAEATDNPEHIRKAAHASLAAHERMRDSRRLRMATLSLPQDPNASGRRASPFIPETVLTRLSTSAAVDEETRTRARRDLAHLRAFMARLVTGQQADHKNSPKDAPYRAVYDAKMTNEEANLPGELIRAEGEAVAKDKDVNSAFDNVGHVIDFYKEIFNWKSIDNNNADVISSVHFGEHYQNAFWDPEKMQMVFGDGGEFLGNFTKSLDVIGHEMTHAVTEHTSPLEYMDQPGALNEHVADVFGIMVKQKIENETADKADWLIGEGCLLPDVKGVALRSMKAPGTAYDDPRFGKDPQVARMNQYRRTYEDNGGVHVYSGIPNKAFYLAAVAFGGYSWEKAGQIWWKTMNSGKVKPRFSFRDFAKATIECANDEFGQDAAKTVRKAWTDVGVMNDA